MIKVLSNGVYLSRVAFSLLKHLLLLKIEFIAAVSSQAPYLIHVRGGNYTTILFSDPIKGEGKLLSGSLSHDKINLEYKILSDSE